MRRNNLSIFSILLIACVTWQSNQTNAANILGLFTSHSPSHLIVHMSLVKALAEKGHNVTVVVSHVPKVKHEKINVIIIPPTKQEEEMISKGVSAMAGQKNNLITTIGNFFGSLKHLIDIQAHMLKDPRFTALYKNPDTKFDLVISGYFMNSFVFGVAAKFNAPLVVSWMGPPMLLTDIVIGNPSEVSYVPDMNLAVKVGEKMTFLQRLQNFLSNIFFTFFKQVLDFKMRSFYK